MKVYFSTVVRSAPLKNGGEIVLLNWQNKSIEAKKSIYPTNPEIVDPNPRGNARGGRGIEIVGDNVIVANYHTLEIYDRMLCHQRNISNPLMVGLHEIFTNDNKRIWACSTTIDAVLRIDLATNNVIRQYWPREMPGFQRELNLTPLLIDKKMDNRTNFLDEHHTRHSSHLHLNAVAIWRGELYALFNAFGVIANLDRGEIAIQDKSLNHAHNLFINEDGIVFVNNTFSQAIHIYNLQTKKLEHRIKLANFKLVRQLNYKHLISYFAKGVLKKLYFHKLSAPRPVFVRGMDKVDDLLFVGISPATILCVHWPSGKLVDYYSYSSDVAVCVHGIKIAADQNR